MTAAEIAEQFDASPCVGNLTRGQLLWLVVLLLWRNVEGDVPMTASDIQDLFDTSPCVGNLTEGQLEQLSIMLLFDGGGGGGGGTNHLLQGDGPPAGGPFDPPSAPAENWAYWDRISGTIWWWNTSSAAWE